MKENLHIVCPHCQGVNRIPAARQHDNPRCGKCKQPLFNAQPVSLDGSTFDCHMKRNDIPVLVDFWADWCGPCKMMAPAYTEAAAKLEPDMRLTKLDTEAAPEIAGRYGIRSIPTLILFQGGQERARQSGAMGAADIVRWARSQ